MIKEQQVIPRENVRQCFNVHNPLPLYWSLEVLMQKNKVRFKTYFLNMQKKERKN